MKTLENIVIDFIYLSVEILLKNWILLAISPGFLSLHYKTQWFSGGAKIYFTISPRETQSFFVMYFRTFGTTGFYHRLITTV